MNEVAVIIPTLNEEKFIGKCLDSVLRQSYPLDYINIIIVDGGSTDRTEKIVNEYIAKYNFIRLLNNPKKIQSVAFNIGIKNTTAPYIIRLDAHAIYNPQYIEKCVQALIEHPECGNAGGVWNIRPQNNSLQAEANAILNQVKFGIGGASYRVGAVAGYVDTVPFGAFPRKVIKEIGDMREDLPRGEDNEYNSRIKRNGYKIYLDPEISCTYFARDSILKSVKQMYANGFSIGRLIHIDRDSVNIRHLVPFAFVTSLLLLVIGGFFYRLLWYLIFLEVAIYFTTDVIASFKTCLKFGFKFFPILLIFFPLVHLSYGFGTLVGLMRKY